MRACAREGPGRAVPGRGDTAVPAAPSSLGCPSAASLSLSTCARLRERRAVPDRGDTAVPAATSRNLSTHVPVPRLQRRPCSAVKDSSSPAAPSLLGRSSAASLSLSTRAPARDGAAAPSLQRQDLPSWEWRSFCAVLHAVSLGCLCLRCRSCSAVARPSSRLHKCAGCERLREHFDCGQSLQRHL